MTHRGAVSESFYLKAPYFSMGKYHISNISRAAFQDDCNDKEALEYVYRAVGKLLHISGKIRESALFWGRDTTYLHILNLWAFGLLVISSGRI